MVPWGQDGRRVDKANMEYLFTVTPDEGYEV